MPYQIINDGPVTPNRLKTLLDLFYKASEPTLATEFVSQSLQPLDEDAKTVKDVLKVAVKLGLVDKKDKEFSLIKAAYSKSSTNEFRNIISSILLAEIPEKLGEKDNDLFPLFSAWAVVNSERFNSYPRDSMIEEFISSIKGYSSDHRSFNTTKYNNYIPWAVFLGLGFNFQKEYNPIPIKRIWEARGLIFQEKSELVAKTFFQSLGKVCPELDGGKNFARFDKGKFNKKTISYATSMALRILHDEGKLELIAKPDAELWQLSGKDSHPQNSISHIILKH